MDQEQARGQVRLAQAVVSIVAAVVVTMVASLLYTEVRMDRLERKFCGVMVFADTPRAPNPNLTAEQRRLAAEGARLFHKLREDLGC